MGSLTTCLKKAGDAIDPGDKAAVIARARELRAKGLTPTAAAAQAVQEQLAQVRALMEAEQKAPAEQATVAETKPTHQDPGEAPEVATQAVVNEAIETAAENRDVPRSQMRRDALRLIDEAIAKVPSEAETDKTISVGAATTRMGRREISGYRSFDDDRTISVEAREGSDAKWTVTDVTYDGSGTGKRRNKVVGTLVGGPAAAREQLQAMLRRIRPDGTLSEPDTVTIEVPGDGTFKVLNTRERLEDFRKTPGFSDKGTKVESARVNGYGMKKEAGSAFGVEAGSGPARAAIENMIDEGDAQAAVDYAAMKGIDIREALKGDKKRLDLIAGLEPTADTEPEAAETEQPAARNADTVAQPEAEAEPEAALPETDLKGFTRVEQSGGAFDLVDGNMRVRVEPAGEGRFQAFIGSAKSSPQLDLQGAVDWADNYRRDAVKAAEQQPAPSEPAKPTSVKDRVEATKEKPTAAAPIADIGEKIGGARKDTAVSTGPGRKRATDDDRPAWARRFQISQIVTPGGMIGEVKDAGRWIIRDSRSLDWTGKPKQVGRDTFATREEAEAFVPIAAVGLKHRVVMASTKKGEPDRYEIWRDITDRKRVKVVDRQFASRDEAMAYMVANAVAIIETNTTFGEADLPLPPNRQRTGPARRDGNVGGDDFKNAFGFRAVEFGNWNNQDERQALMNDAWDGLMDLADVLGLPPRALGLNGDLAMAFGARGQGLNSARAHYETDRAVINLTKEKGAGSLAHEWFHALDHYFGRQDGKTPATWDIQPDGTRTLKAKGGDADMASGGFLIRSGVRPEVRAAYEKLLTTMVKKAEVYVEDMAKVDKFTGQSREELARALDALRKDLSEQKDPRYWKRNNKPASAEVLAEFDSIAKAMLDGDVLALTSDWRIIPGKDDAATRAASRYTNDSLERLSALYKQVRGRTGFSADKSGTLDRLRGYMTRYSERLKMLADAQTNAEKTRMVPTEFAMNARELDQGRGTDYWTTPHELAARAFQGYVEDKVAERGGTSRFLNYAPENAAILTPWGFKRPYPAGHERKAINAEFDNLLRVIETRTDDAGNVAMFSRATSVTTTTDPDTGAPTFNGDGLRIDFPQDTERLEFIDAGRVVNYAIMPSDSFDAYGMVELVIGDDGIPTALADIEIKPEYRGQGIAERTVAAILAANPDADITISNIVEDARGFWARMGVPEQNRSTGEAYDGTLNWQTYSEAANARGTDGTAAPGRAAGEGRNARAEDRRAGPDARTQAGRVRGSDAAALRADLAKTGVKNVNIVQSVDDLPDSKRRAILAREPSGRVRGAYFPDDGSIWLVADNLNSPMEVAFVLMHEAFHRGIAKTLGADAKTVMRQMYLTNPRLNKLTRDLMALHGIGQDEAVEEALADLAGEGRARDLRGWDRLMKLIRDWLGKVAGALGADLRWSDDMIEDFVAGIRNVGLEGGVQVEAGGPGVTMSLAAGIITTKQIGSDLWAVVRNAGTGNEQHLGYHGNEADANEAAERARTEASRAPGRGARWWPANPAEPIQSAGGSGLDSVGRARALKTTLDGRKDAVSSRAEALELEQLPERAGFCFKLAAEASAAGVGDYVIGSAPGPDGNPIWHAVVMRDGAIYDPTFGRWFEPGVYESAGFTPHTTLTTQAVRDFIAASGGWAPDAGRLGIGDESGAKLSRAPGQNQPAWSSIRDARLPAGYIVNDFIESHGKLSWWSRTVGTMHNLAQRSPEFKRVYDAVQNFLGDVSLYATEAANEAPNLLPKLETFRDITKTPLSAEDTKAIAGPIFEGTLSWTRDENGEPVPEDDPQKAGIVWTDAELRDRFKLGDRQIKLYREFRSAVDKSLTDLIISDMLRYAGKDAEPVRDEVLSAMTPERAARILQEHLAELADAATPERAATLSNTGTVIGDKAAQARRLMDRGYAPLTRYGHYTLDVVDANGERAYFGLFESEAEANRMARRLREAHHGAQVAQGTLSERAYQLFAGVSPETLELFGNMLGLESQGDDAASRAFQEYLKLAKSNRSAMKRLIERKGIAGFSEDAGRVLAGFVYSNARQTAKNLHFGEITTATQAIAETKGKGQLLDAAVDLHQYVTNPREEAQQIKGLLFAQFLGGSLASAMVNLTQPLAVAMPYLSQWGGARRAATQVTRALKDALAWETTTDPARRTTGDKALDAAMKRAEEEGIVSPQEVHQLIAQAGGSGALQAGDGTAFGDALAKASNFRSKFMLAWGRPFSLAEQFNRRATYIAAYRTAVEEGQSDPAAFAARAIAETMFTYNKGNRPAWARGAIGSVLFTFKTYSISYVELMVRMAQSGKEGRRAALIGIATLALMSGLQGLPGADDLDDLIDGALQRMGYNFSSKRAKQEFLASIIGDDGARFVMTGLSGLPGVPIDVSGRLGLGNFIPGTGLLTKKDDYTRDALEVLGPVGSLAKQFGTAAGKIAEGEVWEGVKAALPVAAANAVKASDMASTGMYRDDRGRKVIDTDAVDAAFKAIGFQPTDVSRVQQASFEVQKMVSLTRIREAEIADKWARGMFDGNSDLIDEARAELARWNESNPATRIRITSKQLVDRLKNMRMGKTERIAKTAPREVRETVRRELEKAQ